MQQPKRAEHLLRGLEAIGWFFRQQSTAQLVDTGVELGPKLGWRRRMHVKDLTEDLDRVAAFERPAGGQALEQDRAQRKQIAPAIERPLLHLLGGHVAGRADERVLVGQRNARVGLRRERVAAGDELGDAEVEQLGLPGGRDDHVLGLEIPVDDASSVGGRQGVGDMPAELKRLAHRHRSPRQPGRERLALDVLQDDVGATVGIDADVVDGTDAGVVDGRDGPSLLEQSCPQPLVRPVCRGHELDGDVAVEDDITAQIHVAHAAGPNEPAQAIVSELCAHGHSTSCRAAEPLRCVQAVREVYLPERRNLLEGTSPT